MSAWLFGLRGCLKFFGQGSTSSSALTSTCECLDFAKVRSGCAGLLQFWSKLELTSQSSLVCSILCVWMSALLLSFFLFELRELEGLPTERCSTESQVFCRGGREWKEVFVCGQEEDPS